MYWVDHEDEPQGRATATDVIDLAFRIDCARLPVDHAWPLCEAIHRHLPWLPGERRAGIHLVHGGESGNGWQRPGDADYLELPRRTRLTLRLPRERRTAAESLRGQRLVVGNCTVDVGEPREKPLVPSSTVFSRYVECREPTSESAFLDDVASALSSMGVAPRKMLCGRTHVLASPQGDVHVRSVMIADLGLEDSMIILQTGIGDRAAFGLGLFLPHKGIDAVFNAADG